MGDSNTGNALLLIFVSLMLYTQWHVMGSLAKIGFILLGAFALATWRIPNSETVKEFNGLLRELQETLIELREYLEWRMDEDE